MKISIITPTLNSGRYLQDCIRSVKEQSYKNVEHIIIDGGSSDNTQNILQDYKDSIKWLSEPDRGMYDAINKGIRLCEGEVIGVLNSDDVFADANVLERIITVFAETNTDSIYGDLIFVQPNDLEKIYRFWKSGNYERSKFNLGWMPPHPTFYHKKELIDKFGGYQNHYYTSADYDLMCRYLFVNKISTHYIPQVLVKMRKGGISNGSLLRRLRANRRDYLAMKANGIPFPLLVSLLKPLSKLRQYKKLKV